MVFQAKRGIRTLRREGYRNLLRKAIGYVGHRYGLSTKQHIRKLQHKDNLVVAEIGVWKGKNAEKLTRELDISEMYLIDPYEPYEEYEENSSHKKMREAKKEAHEKLEHRSGIRWIEAYSSEAVKHINEEFDYIYVDANHSYDFVMRDIENYYPLVSEGGILAGHDINMEGVARAFVEFTVQNDLQPYVEPFHPDWYIIKGQEMRE